MKEYRDCTEEIESCLIASVLKMDREIGIPGRDLLFEITPSFDSGIGSHFDIDLYIGENRRFYAHLTTHADLFKNYAQERANWARTIINCGGEFSFCFDKFDYRVRLNSKVTVTDSPRIASSLFKFNHSSRLEA
jgi:hypothetical protein